MRFADDIVLLTYSLNQVHTVVKELAKVNKKVRLAINIQKAKVTASKRIKSPLIIDLEQVREVIKFVFLEHLLTLKRDGGIEKSETTTKMFR